MTGSVRSLINPLSIKGRNNSEHYLLAFPLFFVICISSIFRFSLLRSWSAASKNMSLTQTGNRNIISQMLLQLLLVFVLALVVVVHSPDLELAMDLFRLVVALVLLLILLRTQSHFTFRQSLLQIH